MWSRLRMWNRLRVQNRHCERSEAIHLAARRKEDGLLRCARNDVDMVSHTTSFSRRDAPEACIYFPPKEGVGNAGCPLHPRPRVHLVVVERTRVTTSTPESPGIPARNGFNGLCSALPGDRYRIHTSRKPTQKQGLR